jgi:hypothetical protein
MAKNGKMKSADMDNKLRKESGGDVMRSLMAEMASGRMTMRVHHPKLPKMPPMSSFVSTPE